MVKDDTEAFLKILNETPFYSMNITGDEGASFSFGTSRFIEPWQLIRVGGVDFIRCVTNFAYKGEPVRPHTFMVKLTDCGFFSVDGVS